MTAVVQDNHAVQITSLNAEHRQIMDVLEENHAQLIASLNEEIGLLRARGGEILGQIVIMKQEKKRLQRHEWNVKRSVLRAFRWKDANVDAACQVTFSQHFSHIF